MLPLALATCAAVLAGRSSVRAAPVRDGCRGMEESTKTFSNSAQRTSDLAGEPTE